MWTAIGIVLFCLGLLFSIAWHELGHLTFAKLFKVRTTEYMIGFGKTIWSVQRGETRYGIKAIPLGGYIRMVGMVPPDDQGRRRITATSGPAGMIRQIIDDTRAGDREQVRPEDEGRQFYQLHPAKRLIIMFAGPAMNLILAVGIFAVLLMGVGVQKPTTTVASVSACVVPASAPAAEQNRSECPPAQWTPARVAGLRPGDQIVTFNGVRVDGQWDELTAVIRAGAGKSVAIGIIRDGRPQDIAATIVLTERPAYDAQGNRVGTVPAGFLGVGPQYTFVPQSFGAVLERTGQFIQAAAKGVAAIPTKIPALWHAIFDGKPRDLDSPVGIVGAGILSGEILAQDNALSERLTLFLMLLAGFNMSLFLLNLLPLLPLDGGHILGALIEWIRRGIAKLRGRPVPRPFDVAKLMPVAYIVALLFVGLFALTLVADVVNPVKLF